MMARKGPILTQEEDASARCMGCCCGMFVVGLIVFAFVLFWVYLEDAECKAKPWKCREYRHR